MIFVAIPVIATLFVGANYYLWRRLVRDTTAAGGWPRRIGTTLTVLLPLFTVASFVGTRAGMPFVVLQILAWPGYFWVAMFLYLLLGVLIAEPIRLVALRVLRRRAAAAEPAEPAREMVAARRPAAGEVADPAEPVDKPADGDEPAADTESAADDVDRSRRLFVSRSIALVAGAAAVATVGYGASVGMRAPKVKHVTVPLAKLPRSSDGYRIAVVSDIHLGPITGRAHCQRIVDVINGTQPDLITVVGDLVDGSVEDLRPAAEPLTQLRSPDGSFFVTGNHEYFSGAEEWVDHVRELGITPLENARTELAGFDLAGVNDVSAEESDAVGPNFDRALGDRDPNRTSILMAHQPVVIHDAVDYGVDLQLSGHTHGGQMWPITYIADLANPTLAGLERYGDTQLYVTRGAGTWGPPVRVGAQSDITVITLRSGQ